MSYCSKAGFSGTRIGLFGLTAAAMLASTALFTLVISGCETNKSERLGTGVLAMVDGEAVTVDDFKAANGGAFPKDQKEKESALETMINRKLLVRKAHSEGFVNDPAVSARIEMLSSQYLPDLLRKKIAGEVTVTDEELAKFKGTIRPMVQASLIVTGTGEEAEAAMSDIKKGMQFEQVLSKRSTLKATDREISLDDDLYPIGVRAVINRLKPGEVSPPMKMEMGYVIFKIKSRMDPERIWESKKESVRQDVRKRKAAKEIAKLIAELRSKADIKMNNDAFTPGKDQSWVAQVNGIKISMNPVIITQMGDPHTPHQGMKPEYIRNSVINWVNDILLAEEARRLKLDQAPEFQRMFKAKTEDAVIECYVDKIKGDYQPTEKDIREYYDKNKGMLASAETVRVSRILLPTRERAQEALRELGSGKDFASVAKRMSIDQLSRDNGGDAGFVPTEKLKSPLKEVVSGLKAGRTSGVVQTDYGFEILKVTEIKKPVIPEISAARETIIKRVKLEKQSDRLMGFYKQLFDSANVKIDKALLKSL